MYAYELEGLKLVNKLYQSLNLVTALLNCDVISETPLSLLAS